MSEKWMLQMRKNFFRRDFTRVVGSNESKNNPKPNDKLHMKYEVDDGFKERFAISPRGLNITNIDDKQCWEWNADSDGIEVAKVVRTKWLEVKGSFNTTKLLNNCQYKVSFRLKMTSLSTMKGQMLNLKLARPDGTNEEKQGLLPNDESWHELVVGHISMTPQNMGEMKISMWQLFEEWQTGLIISGIEIMAV